ncbi:EAL domain-containing protein [Kineosporia babensis]|uniref:EAL domain-containing protein n=1 Tax=Kineosporia babensis TaxID=499548 RepID=A0A9X1SSA7_9ACTN|nr:EAL domain-containing protein [Kineosporia babensis]
MGTSLLVSLVLVLQLGSPTSLARLSAGSVAACALLTAAAGARRGLLTARQTPARSIWLILAAALGLFGLSQSATLAITLTGPGPVLEGLRWLALALACPLFLVGVVRLLTPHQRGTARVRTLLDGTMIGWAILIAVWVTVLGPALRENPAAVGALSVTGLFATLIITISLTVYLAADLHRNGVQPAVPWWSLVSLVVLTSVADTWLAYATLAGTYRIGNPLDAFWLLGISCLLAGALLPARPRSQPLSHRRRFGEAVPNSFIIAATLAAAAMPELTGFRDDISRWLSAVLILMMLAHQTLARRENRSLTQALEQRVEAGHKRFQALVENSSDVIGLVDRDGVLSYVSNSVGRVLGAEADAIVGLHVSALLDEKSNQIMNDAMARVSAVPLSRERVELNVILPGGTELVMEEVVTNMLDDPAVNAYVLNARDITERRRLEDDLVHQAFHDTLTGLANRALFNDRVQHALHRRAGTEQPEIIGVLFLDLNGFKSVNDTLGHAAGDALLVEVAARLTACLRPGDTIARLGGDEFAVLVEGAQAETEFVDLAMRLHQALEPAIVVNDQELFVGTSIGIAGAEVGSIAVDQLIRNADLAMYQAKERRDGRPARYDPSLHHDLLERVALESDLRRALVDQELEVHYQPTIVLESGAMVGVEALVRWPHPERGMVRPDLFIPIAEQTGMIHELGRQVLRRACAQGQEWAQLSPQTALTVAVNVSAKQLQRRDFVDEVREVLLESGFPAERLVLEMTESVLVHDAEATLDTLQALKAMGVRIAIDDFGTGYSSLSYLHRFPVDILKIDRSFVERLSGTEDEDNLVESIVQLGHTLRLETIAEGIEEADQIEALRRLGCQMAQGYHFGRPVPAQDLSHLIAPSLPQPSPELLHP